jgi:uncharacterized MnhB-related membrane protein
LSALVAAALLLTAFTGLLVVAARNPARQAFALAANGLMLGVLFFVLRAPDVAYSEIAVGTAVIPLLYLATLAALRMNQGRR